MILDLKPRSPFDVLSKAEIIAVKQDGIVTLVYKCKSTGKQYTTSELDEINLKLMKKQNE